MKHPVHTYIHTCMHAYIPWGDVGGAGVAVSGDDDEVLFGSAHHHADDDADLFDS